MIFDQSGAVVFENAQYDNQWDGGDLASGTYIYKLYNKESNYQNSGLVHLKK